MIKPLPNYLLVEPIEDEVRTSAGLYVPDSNKDKPSKGKVLLVGSYMSTPNIQLPLYDELSKSKTVIYKKFVNQEIEEEGKKYLLISFSDVLAVIE